MIALLRAEFRKLLTVRSTYIISILALLLIGFLAFYVEGYKGTGADPRWMSFILDNTSTVISLFIGIVAILLMGHEYRYTTIMYTLTSANSRTKVLLSKVLTVVVFSLGLTALATLFAILTYLAGVSMSPTAAFVAPELLWNDVWRAMFHVVGYGLMSLLFATLFRHLVGAIATLFILPTVEGLLSMLLKDNAKFLPFSSLEQVHTHFLMSSGQAALVFTSYLVGAWLIAWYLFVRRDAN